MGHFKSERIIPALRFDFLTPLFDPVLRWTMREQVFKRALVEQAGLAENARVLDVGCGTGTLLVELSRRRPGARLTGLDADSRILAIGAAKAVKQRASIQFTRATSTEMPYPSGSFDRVVSSLFFHHLDRTAKMATLREIHRVLAPDGELHIADFGKASGHLARLAFYQVQWLDGFATTRDSVEGLLPEFCFQAGFSRAAETRRFDTLFGTLALYVVNKSVSPIASSAAP